MRVRAAKSADKERCMELLAMLGRATGGSVDAGAARTLDLLLAEERGRVLVADDGGQLLGLASVSYNLAMRYGGEYCQLEELIVDPEARGRNVGGLLIGAVLEQARTRGCAECGLYLVESTEHNRPFYEKYGFVRVGTEMRQRL